MGRSRYAVGFSELCKSFVREASCFGDSSAAAAGVAFATKPRKVLKKGEAQVTENQEVQKERGARGRRGDDARGGGRQPQATEWSTAAAGGGRGNLFGSYLSSSTSLSVRVVSGYFTFLPPGGAVVVVVVEVR